MSRTKVGYNLDGITFAAGVVLGVGSRVVDLVGARWVGNVAALWLLVAFLIGRRSPDARRGAVSGVLCLMVATFAYYAWRVFVDGNISNRYLFTVGVLWLVVAIAVGVVAGWASSRSRTEPFFWGLPAGAFLGEAIAVALLSQRFIQVVFEVMIASFIGARTRPEHGPGVRLALATATLIAIAALLYRPVLHA